MHVSCIGSTYIYMLYKHTYKHAQIYMYICIQREREKPTPTGYRFVYIHMCIYTYIHVYLYIHVCECAYECIYVLTSSFICRFFWASGLRALRVWNHLRALGLRAFRIPRVRGSGFRAKDV